MALGVLAKALGHEEAPLKKAPAIFLVLGLLLGVSYAIVMPPLQVPDEVAHYYRAHGVSDGACVVGPDATLPDDVHAMIDIYPEHLESVRRVTLAEIATLLPMSVQEERKSPLVFLAIGQYSCLSYVPAAMAMAAGRHARLSALGLMYIGRLANLLLYVLIVFTALHLLPDLRLLLLAIALMPMTLHQAASLSADSMQLAVTFLLCAVILKLAFDDNREILKWYHLAALALLFVASSLCKWLNPWLIFLVLLIPAARFRTRERWLWLALYLALTCGAVGWWHYANRVNASLCEAVRYSQGIHIGDNIRFIYREPVLFARTLANTCYHSGQMLTEFVGKLGWLCLPLPRWLVWGYTGLLLGLASTQTRRLHLAKGDRWLIGGSFVASVMSVFLLIWLATEERYITTEIRSGRGLVHGIQGRYFIPFSLLFFLLFSNRKLQLKPIYAAILVVAGVLVANTVALGKIVEMYYSSASTVPPVVEQQVMLRSKKGMSRYERMLVRRPGPTPEDGKIYAVQEGIRHWIMDHHWIINHGYRWPADVTTIPAEDLAAIPLGDPIQGDR